MYLFLRLAIGISPDYRMTSLLRVLLLSVCPFCDFSVDKNSKRKRNIRKGIHPHRHRHRRPLPSLTIFQATIMLNIAARESWKGSLTSGRLNWKGKGEDEGDGHHDDDKAYPNEIGVVVTTSTSSSSVNMAVCRGNDTDSAPVGIGKANARALRHVLDDLEDHFGHQRDDPNVRFNLSELRYDKYGLWFGNLSFDYMIGGEVCNLDYIGIDVCIDLTQKRSNRRTDNAFDDYGKSWVYAYIPELTMDKIKEYVKAGTGWDCSNEGIGYDPNRNVVAIEAKMHQEPQHEPPTFWVASDSSNSNAGDDDNQFSCVGSVQHVGSQPFQQGVHRGVAFFNVSLEVESSSQNIPTPGTGREASLIFTLYSVRTWGTTNLIAPIVHSTRKF